MPSTAAIPDDAADIGFIEFSKQNRKAPLVLLLCVIAFVFNQVDRFLFTTSQVPFITPGQYAAVAGPGFTVAFTLAGIVASRLGETLSWNPFKVLAAALMGWSAATVLVAITDRFWQVAALRVALGVFQSACNPFAATLITQQYSSPALRGTALGIYNIGIYVGYDLALATGGALSRSLGWAAAYVIFGVLGGVVSILLWGYGAASGSDSFQCGCCAAYSQREEKTALLGDVQVQAKGDVTNGGAGGGDSSAASSASSEPAAVAKPTSRQVARFWCMSASLVLLCVAGGVRNAGGYVWGYYTPVFYSPLLKEAATRDGKHIACTASADLPPGFTPVQGLAVAADGADDGAFSRAVGAGVLQCSIAREKAAGLSKTCGDAPCYPLCLADDKGDHVCQTVSDTPWHEEGMTHKRFETFLSWIPAVAGSIGAVLGGYVTDQYAKKYGPAGRVGIITVSNLLAAPFCFGALYAPYPWCFLCLLGTNVFGEMWIGATLALVSELVPASMRASSFAIYAFVITNIGGNAPGLVPSIQKTVAGAHTYTITDVNNVAHTVTHAAGSTSHGLQVALTWMYPGVYALSCVVFVTALVFLKRDIRKAAEAKAAGKEGDGAGNVLVNAAIDDYDRMDMADP